MVLDRAGDEHDPLAQQAGIDVEAALAPVGLLDDDGDELRNDVLMVDQGKRILCCGAPYIGANSARFKAAKKKGGPEAPDRPLPSLKMSRATTSSR